MSQIHDNITFNGCCCMYLALSLRTSYWINFHVGYFNIMHRMSNEFRYDVKHEEVE